MLIDIPEDTLRRIIAKYYGYDRKDDNANPALHTPEDIADIITDVSTVL